MASHSPTDMTPDAVDARLRELSRLSADAIWPPLVDMSSQAVTSRLLECAEISALAIELEAAGAAHFGR